ncbi:MAG: hypothetical protein HUJ30_00895 [Gammaproteobacteria bacterium]|nr:hypothetical protein [Gammaproteobacteria bacterium]
MGPIELALLFSFIFFVLWRYRIQTDKLAIARRADMVPVVKAIMGDDNSSELLKTLSGILFVHSMDPWVLVKAFASWPFIVLLRKKDPAQGLSEEESKKYREVLKHFFKVNSVAAPHWYIVFVMIMFTLAVPFIIIGLIKRVWRSTMPSLESSLIRSSGFHNAH